MVTSASGSSPLSMTMLAGRGVHEHLDLAAAGSIGDDLVHLDARGDLGHLGRVLVADRLRGLDPIVAQELVCHCAGSLVGVVRTVTRAARYRSVLAAGIGADRRSDRPRDLVVGREASNDEPSDDVGDLVGRRAQPAGALEVAVGRDDTDDAVGHERRVVVTDETEIDALADRARPRRARALRFPAAAARSTSDRGSRLRAARRTEHGRP